MTGQNAAVCSQCQSPNSADALFCDECGAPLDARCLRCGEANRFNAKFCKKCGNRLAAGTDLNATSLLYTQGAAAEIAGPKTASGHDLSGERKQVTVMFADICGSTAFIEKLDPEVVRAHFDPVLRLMSDAVHRYGGTVNQVLGDGIMALFGAPMAHEDHAVRACYAALAMQEELRRSGAKSDAAGHSLSIGIGLNSGEVVVRSFANDLNFDYSALGQTTHLAARMQELAGPGTVLLTSASAREVEGFVQLKALGARQAKGVSKPLDVFQLVGATAARTRLQVAARRGLTPFVGRDREIEHFHRLTEKVVVGGGQVLAMVGEAGMGKSRLVREFCENHLPAGWRVISTSAISFGKATPYFPVIELLRRYLSLSEEDGRETVQAKVVEKVRSLDEALADVVPPILTLLDASPGGVERSGATRSTVFEEWAELAEAAAKFNNLEPAQRRRHTLDSVKRLLLRESQNQPLLVVFEDLHWIDAETQSVLNSLVESLPATPILLLVNYRIGYKHDWIDKPYYSQFRVDRLPPDGAEALLQSLLGHSEELRPLRKLLTERTDGNPFFAEEIVRALVEAGSLLGSKGAYELGRKLDTLGIPSTVHTVLAERIDRLAHDQKQLLQCAAAVGVVVPWRLLRAVAELPDEELYRGLSNLVGAEFLYESNLFPELEYSFTHALTNEVAYGALLSERRFALHQRILSALEDFAVDGADDSVDALAYHAMRGEMWDKAATYQRRAGNKALSRSAFADALASYERAFEALSHLAESRENIETQIDLHLDCRNVLFLLGDLSRVGEELAKAEALAERLGDEARLARVLNFQNSYYGLVGDPERAIEAGRRVMALSVTKRDKALLAVSQYYTGVAYNKIAQYDRAAAVLRSGMQSVEGELRFEQYGTAAILSVIFRSHLSQSLAMTGCFEEGIVRGAEGVRIADEANHFVSLTHINSSLGFLFLFKGDFDKAIPVLENALSNCENKHIPIYVPLVTPRLGWAYFNVGRVEEGLRLLERSIEDSASVGRAGFLALNLTWLGEAYLAVGRTKDAVASAEQAVELAKQHKELGHHALALKLCADIAARGSVTGIKQALDFYEQALNLGRSLGMRPLQAHCLAGLGTVFKQTGEFTQARKEFQLATDLYRATGMTAWLAKTEFELAQLCENIGEANLRAYS